MDERIAIKKNYGEKEYKTGNSSRTYEHWAKKAKPHVPQFGPKNDKDEVSKSEMDIRKVKERIGNERRKVQNETEVMLKVKDNFFGNKSIRAYHAKVNHLKQSVEVTKEEERVREEREKSL